MCRDPTPWQKALPGERGSGAPRSRSAKLLLLVKLGAPGARGPGADPSSSSPLGDLLHVLYIGTCCFCVREAQLLCV